MNKKIMVTQSSMPSLDEYIDEIKSLWETRWLTNMGEKHEKLRKLLRTYLGVENIDLFTNGHMALELTLQGMNLKGEVITTPFTFASTTHAIVRNGLTPVFCDINEDDYTIDTSKIEELITDKTCAILPVHVYGNICNVEEIDRIAKKYELKVIYDAAHSFGEKYKGIGIGNYGDASCFSFHATKVFNTIEGGAVCFKDSLFGNELYALKNFGIFGPEDVNSVGANAKLNEFSAAMGICNIKHIDDEIVKRKQVVNRYRYNLESVEGIKLNPINHNVISNYSYFPIVINEKEFGCSRSELFMYLKDRDIYTRKYFYPLTSSFSAFRNRYDSFNTPVAVHVSKRVLTLPLYSDLDLNIVDDICQIIRDCKKNY